MFLLSLVGFSIEVSLVTWQSEVRCRISFEVNDKNNKPIYVKYDEYQRGRVVHAKDRNAKRLIKYLDSNYENHKDHVLSLTWDPNEILQGNRYYDWKIFRSPDGVNNFVIKGEYGQCLECHNNGAVMFLGWTFLSCMKI